MTQLLCQGPYVEGNKPCCLLRAALGEPPLCWTIGIPDQGCLPAPEALQQEGEAEGQVSLVASKQDETHQQTSLTEVDGSDLRLSIRSGIDWRDHDRDLTL